MTYRTLVNRLIYPAYFLLLTTTLMAISPSLGVAAKANQGTETNFTPNQPKQSVRLKNSAIVEGEYIRLGDLFTNVGKYAETRIAHSPKPGTRSKYGAEWLYRVARAYRLDWRPLTLKTTAVIERASQEIHREEVEDALLGAIRDQGYKGKFDIILGNRALNIHIPTDVPATIEISSISINRSTGRFVATLITPANTPMAKRFRLSGRVHELIQVPVISKRLNRGDIIRQNDIEWIDVRERTLRRGHIQDESEIIGMAAKRFIPARTPLTSSLMQRPQLVKKNGLVTISLHSGLMRLTTQGRAMESGSLGDVIHVKNGKSKKIIEAEVTGKGAAKVNLIREVALN